MFPRWKFLLLALFTTIVYGASAQTMRFEVEEAELRGPSLTILPSAPAQNRARKYYSGKGYVTGFNKPLDSLLFRIDIKQPGVYHLALGYRTALRENFDISVNNSHMTGTLEPTSGSAFWVMPAGTVDLGAGENQITIKMGWGHFDLDYLELTPRLGTPALAPVTTSPVDPAAMPEARALLSRLELSYGKTTALGVYDEDDSSYVSAQTGVRPSIMGGDLMRYSSFFSAHGPIKDDEMKRLIADARSGQLITLSWHWASPLGALATAEKPWYRAFYTDSTDFDVERALDPGTAENMALLKDIDAIAVQLRRLQDAQIPVLFRPLHEAQGGWFWWGAKGPQPFKRLWALLYDRLVNVQRIHNLLWVYTAADDLEWYPGDAVTDIVSIDAYPAHPDDVESFLWQRLQAQFAGRKLLAISEFGGTPDISRMQRSGEFWAYAVAWSKDLGPRKTSLEDLKRIYTDSGAQTLPSGTAGRTQGPAHEHRPVAHGAPVPAN